MPEDDSKDLEEEFLDHFAAYESREPRALLDVLVESGIALPAPGELDDSQIGAKLWELIHGLALVGTFLHNTDHLSDRELYAELWNEELREPTVLIPENPAYAWHIDMVGSGSPEHLHLYLKHYADEEERRHWQKSGPTTRSPGTRIRPTTATAVCRRGKTGRTVR
jgi:hypothetical protein